MRGLEGNSKGFAGPAREMIIVEIFLPLGDGNAFDAKGTPGLMQKRRLDPLDIR